MFNSARIRVAALGLCLMACDDTGKAIQEEVKEVDTQEVKQDLKEGAAAVGSAAKTVGRKVDEAADETGKVIDKVDKKAAEEIRKD